MRHCDISNRSILTKPVNTHQSHKSRTIIQNKNKLTNKKHRRTLAKSQFLIPHPQLPHNKPFPEALTCAHLFLDPLSWMRPELEQGKVEGRLECPKCKSNVGKYAWQGMRCSCGSWVIPAITLAKGKVDEVRVRTPGEGGVRKVPGVGMPATSAQGRGLL